MIYPNISSIYNNALGALSDPVKNYSKAWACLKIFSETIRMSSYGLPSNFSSLSGRVKSVAQWVDNKIDTSLAPLSGKDGVVSVCCRMGKIALIMIFSDWCLKQSQDSTTADTNDDARKG